MPPGSASGGRRRRGAQPHLDLCPAERGGVDLQSAAGRLGDTTGDIEPEAGRARAAAAAGQGGIRVGDPRARVGDENEDQVFAAMQGDGEPGALFGVLEDVADQRIGRGGEIGPRYGHGNGLVRAGEAARTALVFGERGPELEAVDEDLGGVAPGRLVRPGPSRGPDDQIDLLLQPVDGDPGIVGGPAGPERGRVHPQCRERRTQPVRQVGRHLPLRRDQLAQPLRHHVEGVADGGQLGGPAGGAAGAQVTVAEQRRRRRQLAGGPGDAGGKAVGHDHRDRDQRQRHTGHHRPRRGHATGNRGRGNVDLGDREPPAAKRHRLQDGVTAGDRRDEGPGRGGGHAQVRGARPLRPADQRAAGPAGGLAAVADGRCGGQVDGELAGRARRGADDGAFEAHPVGGDTEHRLDRRPGELGGRECPVPRYVPDNDRERDEKGDRHHRRDRGRDECQRRPHRVPDRRPRRCTFHHGIRHRGVSSITPTPRIVCR